MWCFIMYKCLRLIIAGLGSLNTFFSQGGSGSYFFPQVVLTPDFKRSRLLYMCSSPALDAIFLTQKIIDD